MIYNYFSDITSIFFMIFIFGSLFNSVISIILDWMENKHKDIKEKLKELYTIHPLMKKFTLPKTEKAIKYKSEHSLLSDLDTSISSPIVMLSLMFGVSPFIIHTLLNTFPSNWSPFWSYFTYATILQIIATVYNTPFNIYETFNIEKRYGFNTSNKFLFTFDMIKSFIITLTMNFLLIALFNYILTSFGKFTTTYILLLSFGTILLKHGLGILIMNVISKLFNKYDPLKDKNLTKKINSLTKKLGYENIKILVMDESKRSNHSNAFVYGFGKKHKKIVLTDTLLKNYTSEEILFIIGHELGHAKLHHLEIHRIIDMIKTTAITFLIFSLIYNIDFYHTFGYNWITEENVIKYSYIGYTLATMFIGSFLWILEPLETSLTRTCEYAADKFAIKLLKTNKHGISSIIKLSNDNLSIPFTNRLYEIWNYTHPSLINRIKAMKNAKR